jgi:hypothetical protein
MRNFLRDMFSDRDYRGAEEDAAEARRRAADRADEDRRRAEDDARRRDDDWAAEQARIDAEDDEDYGSGLGW